MSSLDEGSRTESGGLLRAKASFDDVSPDTIRIVLNKLETESQKRVLDGFNR